MLFLILYSFFVGGVILGRPRKDPMFVKETITIRIKKYLIDELRLIPNFNPKVEEKIEELIKEYKKSNNVE